MLMSSLMSTMLTLPKNTGTIFIFTILWFDGFLGYEHFWIHALGYKKCVLSFYYHELFLSQTYDEVGWIDENFTIVCNVHKYDFLKTTQILFTVLIIVDQHKRKHNRI